MKVFSKTNEAFNSRVDDPKCQITHANNQINASMKQMKASSRQIKALI